MYIFFMSIIISQKKYHLVSVYQDIYATYIVNNYLDTSTVKTRTKFYKTTFPSDIIFTKYNASTSADQVENLTMQFNINYRTYIVSLIYLLSKRADLSFAVHKLETFSSNPSKVNFDAMVHLLRYIRDNNTLGLKYSADMNNAPLSNLFRQASINTENQFLYSSDSSWQDCQDTGIITGACIILYQCRPIDHV